MIYDGGSTSNLHALIAAREAAVPWVRARGLGQRAGLPPLRVDCSEQAHSSIDKAVIVLGLGHQALRKIPVDDECRLRPDLLEAAIAEDRAAGLLPNGGSRHRWHDRNRERAAPPGVHPDRLEALNIEILGRVNASGEVFLSHTRLRGRFTPRLAIGHIRTTEAHVARAWELLRDSLAAGLDRTGPRAS